MSAVECPDCGKPMQARLVKQKGMLASAFQTQDVHYVCVNEDCSEGWKNAPS